MILCIDTSYKYLVLTLIKDNIIIDYIQQESFKNQSETIFKQLKILLNNNHITMLDLQSIVVTIGPGSYTGVRIGLTLAKLSCLLTNIKLYTISTLRLYANNKENTMVILDAKAQRVYIGIYNKDQIILDDQIIELKDLNIKDYNLIGDLSLINKQDRYYDISKCFLNNLKYIQKIKDIDTINPIYLKEYL